MPIDNLLAGKLRRLADKIGVAEADEPTLHEAAKALDDYVEYDQKMAMVSSALKALIREIAGNEGEPFIEIDTRRLLEAANYQLHMTAIVPDTGEGAVGWNFMVKEVE